MLLKPDPTESLALLQKFDIKASECAFIGDTDVDIHTGKNMGAALSVGVSWGFRKRDELVAAGADFVVDGADEVVRIIREKI